MRVFIAIVVIVALMVVGGWLVFNVGDSSASVELRTDRVSEDTSAVVEKVRDVTPDVDIEINDNEVDDADVAVP